MNPSGNPNTVEGLEAQVQRISIDEAWFQAYPEPREFLAAFIKKLESHDKVDKSMRRHLERLQAIFCCHVELALDLQTKEEQIREGQRESIRSREAVEEARGMYSEIRRKCQDLQLELDDSRMKYHTARFLGGIAHRDIILYLQKNPKAAFLGEKMNELQEEVNSVIAIPHLNKYVNANPVMLGKKIDLLSAMLNDVDKEKKRVVCAVGKIRSEEKHQLLSRIASQDLTLHSMRERNKELRGMISKMVKQNMDLNGTMRENEKNWMSERESLVRLVSACQNRALNEPISPPFFIQTEAERGQSIKSLRAKLGGLEKSLMEKSIEADKSKVQTIRLMREVDLQVANGRLQKQKNLAEKNAYCEKIEALEKRLLDSENRRKLEAAGFREDVKGLRKSMTKLEKQVNIVNSLPSHILKESEDGGGKTGRTRRRSASANPKMQKENMGTKKGEDLTPETEALVGTIAKTLEMTKRQISELAEAVGKI